MRLACIAFLAGVLCIHGSSEPPSWLLLALVAIASSLAAVRRLWVVCLALAGFIWAGVDAGLARASLLPLELTKKTVQVTGEVVGVPTRLPDVTRFWFQVDRTEAALSAADNFFVAGSSHSFSGLVRLSWYERQAPSLAAGERWRLLVRMQRPTGFSNPGGFDYERWAFQQHMTASGYVRDVDQAQRLKQQTQSRPMDRLRQRLADNIRRLLGERPETALVLALTVGLRSDLTSDQWQVLRNTGTSHLMAISGLHVGLISMLGFLLIQSVWRRWYWGCVRIPSQRAAAIAALLVALAYAAIAGFSVPTQRAVIMVAALVFGLLRGRKLLPGSALAAAALLIVMLDPRAPLSIGFWLSFMAVAALQFLLRQPAAAKTSFITLRQAVRAQVAVSLGLFPLLLVYFGSQPALAPVVNLLAIPLTGWGIVPLALAGVATSTFSDVVANGLLISASWLIALLMQALHAVAAWDLQIHIVGYPGLMAGLLAVLGVVWLGAPRGWPSRWIGLLLLLPLLTTTPVRPQSAQAWLTVLDVGQGLAVVVETRNHTLLYDTGPSFGSRSNAGERVILPYLRYRGIDRLDTLIVSHDDSDHSGGAATIRRSLEISQVFTSRPESLEGAARCRVGQSWTYDGVHFEFLHPHVVVANDNNSSCVLRISVGNTAALLPGDIQRRAERELVARIGRKLESEVLIVPHHGSAGSSTPAFLDAVKPELAVISAGWYNQFGFPRQSVKVRYAERCIDLLSTMEQGAVQLQLDRQGVEVLLRQRPDRQRHWNRQGFEVSSIPDHLQPPQTHYDCDGG